MKLKKLNLENPLRVSEAARALGTTIENIRNLEKIGKIKSCVTGKYKHNRYLWKEINGYGSYFASHVAPKKSLTTPLSEKELQGYLTRSYPKDQDRLALLRTIAVSTVIVLGLLMAFVLGIAIQY